ncbi:MAG: FeoB small GTPase domain-containing protein [Bacillota bacterium]
MTTLVLVGNPNVGKSVVFSRLTGSEVTSSNYSGTTVEYTRGKMKIAGETAEIIDAPGTYSLRANNKAEEVAVDMLKHADVVVNVVDATNLERNLNLTLELLARDIPVVVALNMWDEAEKRGIYIDVAELSRLLGVQVIPTVATKARGFSDILRAVKQPRISDIEDMESQERWSHIGSIIEKVQTITPREPTLLEKLETLSVLPVTGVPIAALVLYASFVIIRTIGEGAIGYVTEPFFENLYKPLLMQLSNFLGSSGIVHDILIGQLIEGEIDFGQSFGVLSTGIFIPLAAVLPYIFSFYLVLSLLEDIGYLPRISVLADNIMHRVGLHGFSIIPMILGLGCNVPAALATRVLEGRREKFITSTLMAIAVPCMAQIAMIVGLLGAFGGTYILYVFGILLWIWLLVGIILNRLLPGFSTGMLMEIPPFRVPSPGTLLRKLWLRMVGFLKEALPFLLAGVLLVNILYTLGIFDSINQLAGPFLQNAFGLPQEALAALIIGFLRKDLALGMLAPLGMTAKQLLTASVVLTVYFPCVATFMVLFRELGAIDMLRSTAVMVVSALFVGTFVNYTFQGGGFTIWGWVLALGILVLAWFLPLRSDPSEAEDEDIPEPQVQR